MKTSQFCLRAVRERQGGAETIERFYPCDGAERAAEDLRDYVIDGWEVELERVECEERRGLIFAGGRSDLDAGYVEFPSIREVSDYRCQPSGACAAVT